MDKEKLYICEKPILFNTERVKTILNGRKTATRRIIKPQPENVLEFRGIGSITDNIKTAEFLCESTDKKHNFIEACKTPYNIGDIQYVRETFATLTNPEGNKRFVYKASDTYPFGEKYVAKFKWRPSIHMPKKAARLFLKVIDVRVEKLQDITDEQARAEGCKDINDFISVWNDCYAAPQPVKEDGVIVRYESYPWEDIQETRTYRGLPWLVIGNPWVWAIEFEKTV